MESPASGSRFVAPGSKKRVFPGGSSSPGFKEASISKTTPFGKTMTKPTTSSKKTEVDCEIINLDSDDEVLIIDANADKKGKGKEISSSFSPVASETFKKFDTVEDCSDHHYAKNKKAKKANPPKNWAKRIQEEWKILEKDLPDTIFVRVYESRMDLLRAVIVGAEGTPYHNGLFFFDVVFPARYPNTPPKVHYHSGGLRLNPNLYECGKVCLSLLGTWDGGEKEMWLPGVSTMLQVLVSIQGLILNADPYYNEPGYENSIGTKRGEENSLQYNETTFLYNLRTMVYTMKRPPRHFEELVLSHFCKHARHILVSCKAYLEGAQVGCLARGGIQDVDEGDKSCSEDFKSSLANFITKLIEALSEIGAKGCDKFLHLAQRVKNGLPAAPKSNSKKLKIQ